MSLHIMAEPHAAQLAQWDNCATAPLFTAYRCVLVLTQPFLVAPSLRGTLETYCVHTCA